VITDFSDLKVFYYYEEQEKKLLSDVSTAKLDVKRPEPKRAGFLLDRSLLKVEQVELS